MAERFEYYNKYAKRYEATLDKTHCNIILDYSAVKLKERMVDGKCLILDVACGSGVTGIALQNAGFTNFHGVDPSPSMLRLAEDKKIYSSLFSGIITQDERLPCGDNAYDGLICISAITKGHLQPNPAIKEFCRIVSQVDI